MLNTANSARTKRCSIRDLSSTIVTLETAAALPAGRIDLGQRLASHRSSARFTHFPVSAHIEHYRIEDAVLDGHLALVFKDGLLALETIYPPEERELSLNPEKLSSVPIRERVIVGFNRWHANYYHWMTQCVPAIYWGCRLNKGDVVLALPGLNRWQEDSLKLLDLCSICRFKLDKHHQYTFTSLEVSAFAFGASTYRPSWTAVEAFLQMKQSVVLKHSNANAIIYISRFDSSSRKMINEKELCEKLSAEGAEIVTPGEYTLERQIEMFARARVVIGAHGAGLTNIIFCNAGTAVYELMSEFSPNPCFAVLARACELDYCADCFPNINENSWKVDIEAVVNTCRKLKSSISRA